MNTNVETAFSRLENEILRVMEGDHTPVELTEAYGSMGNEIESLRNKYRDIIKMGGIKHA